ncbi:hypothetical protein OG440_40610 (plasmid) [Streptomyces sp. NBC_00637]|uniref:hypothetical protein n=1 Tax=Streptomyces sp. NBC_00637 TaxID=2903667 RepID=UPI002F910DB2
MSTAPAAPSGPFSVIVTKPGHDTVRVGPFTELGRAQGFAYVLDHGVRGIGAPAGTRFDVAAYDPHLPHLCVPADDAAGLARQMSAEPGRGGPAGFPDLFTRLVADRCWEDAARAWLDALAHPAPAAGAGPDTGEQPPAAKTFTVFGIIGHHGATTSLDVAGVVAGESTRVDLYDRPWAFTDTKGRFSVTVRAATWQDAEEQAVEGVESGALREPWR